MGGELVPLIGFPDLIRSIGFLNLLFCPFMFLLSHVDYTRIHGTDGEMDSLAPTSSSDDDGDGVSDKDGRKRRNFNQFCTINTPSVAPNRQSESRNSSATNGKGVAIFGDLLPLKSYDTRYVQSTSYSYNYQRFHDQLDSD